MVKRQKKSNKKRCNGKGFKANGAKARKINASTIYETCTEQLNPFGGLLPLTKFLDLIRFKQIIMNNTIRITRLKLLFIAAKVVTESNVDKVKYSIHNARSPAMMHFLKFVDKARSKIRPWEEDNGWLQRFSLN